MEAAKGTGAEVVDVPGGGHFMVPTFPSLAEAIEARLAAVG